MSDSEQLEAIEHGQIEYMKIPPGWVEKESSQDDFDVRSFRTFHPPDNEKAGLYLYYRGQPVSVAAGESLASILAEEPHDLSDEEAASIREVLADSLPGEDFESRGLRSEDWNGRRVLVVEGHNPLNNRDEFHIYIDADGSGCFVQELIYDAPADTYDEYLQAALDALSSIEWREVPEAVEIASTAYGLVNPSELKDLQPDPEAVRRRKEAQKPPSDYTPSGFSIPGQG